MKVLIIGSGGREHAIGYKIKENPRVDKIYFAPGNGGTALLGENITLEVADIKGLLAFATEQKIDLTIVGPEVPLSLGIVDEFKKTGLLIFGPDKNSAQLETSKAFSKAFMQKYGIPTAEYRVFDEHLKADEYIQTAEYPLVIKADGLAAGKGVLICSDLLQAKTALDEIMNKKVFGAEGKTVVIEEFLEGKEVSILCFTDTKSIVPMESASDYKRAHDDDEGLNTGGMGSISPSFYYKDGIADEIIAKTLHGIQCEGFDYCGVIYIGLMLTDKGPQVLEYNVRFGDPETEAILPRLESDLCEILEKVAQKRLSDATIRWSKQSAVTVIVAAEGYPESYKKGEKITLPPDENNAIIFHSGTKIKDGLLVSDGGRVLAITGMGNTIEQARQTAYKAISKVEFPNSFYRKDIGEVK